MLAGQECTEGAEDAPGKVGGFHITGGLSAGERSLGFLKQTRGIGIGAFPRIGLGCRRKAPGTSWIPLQKFTLPQFWEPEVQDKGAGRVASF